jgi:hypothetical protein
MAAKIGTERPIMQAQMHNEPQILTVQATLCHSNRTHVTTSLVGIQVFITVIACTLVLLPSVQASATSFLSCMQKWYRPADFTRWVNCQAVRALSYVHGPMITWA